MLYAKRRFPGSLSEERAELVGRDSDASGRAHELHARGAARCVLLGETWTRLRNAVA